MDLISRFDTEILATEVACLKVLLALDQKIFDFKSFRFLKSWS
nr:hypothetical protein [Photorhabdus heterorhabditis]